MFFRTVMKTSRLVFLFRVVDYADCVVIFYFSDLLFIYYLRVYICACVSLCASCVCSCLHRPEAVGCPRTGVTNTCKPLDVSTENQSWILCKSSKFFWPLNYLYRFTYCLIYPNKFVIRLSQFSRESYFSKWYLCASELLIQRIIVDFRHKNIPIS